MAKTKPLPMPVEVVLHSKHMQFAAGSVYRTIMTITCLFWASGAVLDGLDEAKAQQVSRIATGHWNAIKTPVMAALADILPELVERYAIAAEKREHIKRAIASGALKGRIIVLENRRRRKLDAMGTLKEADKPPLRTPQTADRHVNPMACLSPQALAALPTDEVTARFCDK